MGIRLFSALADTNLSAFIWSVADLLRGDYKQSDYGKVILPFTVLRRLDCVLGPTKAAVLEEKALREGQGIDPEPFLLRKAGHNFCNTSPLDMKRLMGDGDNIAENLRSYIQAFTPAVRDRLQSKGCCVRIAFSMSAPSFSAWLTASEACSGY